jgi:hypothetical protein
MIITRNEFPPTTTGLAALAGIPLACASRRLLASPILDPPLNGNVPKIQTGAQIVRSCSVTDHHRGFGKVSYVCHEQIESSLSLPLAEQFDLIEHPV